MRKKEKRLLVTMFALIASVAALGMTSQPAAAAPGPCQNIAPFCSSQCSCAPLGCGASCDLACTYYVWCTDVL